MSSDLEQTARKLARARSPQKIQELLAVLRYNAKGINTKEAENYRQLATERYSGEDTQIDDDALVSVGSDGAWIQAWVWIDKEDAAITG